MSDEKEFPCPYCSESYGGNIGRHNLEKHIENNHPDKVEEWKKSLIPEKPANKPVEKTIGTPEGEKVLREKVPEKPPEEVIPPRRPLPDYEGFLEPENWLRTFLEKYSPPLKKGFISLISDRTRIRGDLPSAAQLTDDIQSMDSGVSKIHQAAYIAEIYEYELRKYLAQRQRGEEHYKRPYRGIPVREYRTDGYRGPPREVSPWEPRRWGEENYPRDSPSVGGWYERNEVTRLNEQVRRMEDDRRYDMERRMNELQMAVQSAGQRNPDMERLETKIELMEEERRRKQEEELQLIKLQIQQKPAGLRPEDIERMIEAERGKIRGEDIQHMIDQAFAQRGGLSENDVRLQEIQSKHQLEMAKLSESGKTREAIASAVQGGFTSVGQAIFRTAQELGTEREIKLEGQTDNRDMWQTPCPNCNGLITAPLTAKMLTCPTCNKQFEVLPPESEPSRASFTVEPPVQKPETKPIEPKPMPERRTEEGGLVIPAEKPSQFTPEEKKQIEKSLQDAKEGGVTPLEPKILEPTGPEQQVIAQEVQIKKPFVCEECGKDFDKEMQLKGHRLHHFKQKKKG